MPLVIGLVIGTVLGLTGAGGSIFAVPLLMLLLGLPPSAAMGIALGAVLSAAFLGAINQRKQVLWAPAFILSSCGVMAAPIGQLAAQAVESCILTLGFAAIALTIATLMLKQAWARPDLAQYVRANPAMDPVPHKALNCRLSPTGQFQMRPRCIGSLVMGGMVISFASGMFGVGGGFLIVPLLLYLSAIGMPSAVATSLATITLVSLSGFVAHLKIGGAIDYHIIWQVILGSVVGMLISQRLGHKLAGPALQITFAVLLIITAITLVVRGLGNL